MPSESTRFFCSGISANKGALVFHIRLLFRSVQSGFKFILLFLSVALAACSHPEAPRVRPAEWAQPVIGSSLTNAYRVSYDVFRSEQPGVGDLPAIKALGVRSLLSLRKYHTDDTAYAKAGLVLLQHPSVAGAFTEADLLLALALLRDAPKPVLVHCWHGSDRTGAVIAAYRVVFQHWTKDQAVDDLTNGGYGFHAQTFPEIVPLIQSLDVDQLRRQLLPPPNSH